MVRFLNSHGVPCWSDVMLTPHFSASPASRSSSRASSTPLNWERGHPNTLQSLINENMKVCTNGFSLRLLLKCFNESTCGSAVEIILTHLLLANLKIA